MTPILSIIIAVHNNQETLKRCIDSFYYKVEKLGNIEIICINDHSNDNSLRIINEYKNIEIFNSDKRGLGNSRNCGIKYSRGKYLWFIDADDEINEYALNKEFLRLLNNDIELFLLGIEKISRSKTNVIINKYDGLYNIRNDSKKVKKLFIDNILNNSWNKIYRKEVIIKNHLKFDEVSSVEDILFNCKYLQHISTIYTLKEVFYKYYIYSNTSTKWNWEMDKLDVSILMLGTLKRAEKDNYAINNTVFSRVATDTLIGNEINIIDKLDDINYKDYKKNFTSKKMKVLNSYCKYSIIPKYLIKTIIAKSKLLSYIYVRRYLFDRG